jgi:protocatechuate 3,4-dioxygenase beta subunit
MSHDHDAELEDHDRGLSFDLPTLMSRRRALGVLSGSVMTAALAACGSSPKRAATSASGSSADGTGEIPDETAGPYPGDGSNGPNVLTESGIVRSDITTSFGEASGVAGGIPTVAGGTPLAGAAVYLWHCNIDGHFSMYDQDVAEENYLRGVQESDSDGKVRFRSIFPAAYAGRWPHIHFGVYEQSVRNVAQTSLDTDNVFSDGYASQLATTSGTVDSRIAIKLNVGV